MTHAPLSADDIRRLFGELASELDAAGQRAEISLVGGAAIALCFDARRATRDLDAIFAPTDSCQGPILMRCGTSKRPVSW
jgi:hypothetical protein